jgi:hypothetical protein
VFIQRRCKNGRGKKKERFCDFINKMHVYRAWLPHKLTPDHIGT